MMNITLIDEEENSYLIEDELSEYEVTSIGLVNIDNDYDNKIHNLINQNKIYFDLDEKQLIIINDSNFERGFRIIQHLRFNHIQIPILIICPYSYLDIFEKYSFILTKGSAVIKQEDLKYELLSGRVENLRFELALLFKDTDSFKAGFLDKLIIKVPEQQGRHSIANQWGAYRMSEIGGLEIEYNFPKTLYFKYLTSLSEAVAPIKLEFPVVNRILFIDDNCHKGWEDCLIKIFGNDKIKAYKSWSDATLDKVPEQIKKSKFDLILLDLYLDENDRIGKGKEILQHIKEINPIVPVIMFTASNKAWNMDELYEAGADGYYVKEHPETAHDPEFSIKNYENFHATIKNCIKKGTLLRKYWIKIKDIQEDTIIENKIIENGNRQLNIERINERLQMFLGLLKKAFEQTKFDKNAFFYSEWELAFLTLWSTLNEIQEAYFSKSPIQFINTEFKFKGSRSNRPRFQFNHRWEIRTFDGNNLFSIPFIEYDLIFKFDSGLPSNDYPGRYHVKQKSSLNFKKNDSPYYSIDRSLKETSVNYEITLHAQIAFVLLNMRANPTLLRNLKQLNDFRNHLYLTHGEDSGNADFTILYKNQRILDSDTTQSDLKWQKKIEQLFEIIYFLCTGKE